MFINHRNYILQRTKTGKYNQIMYPKNLEMKKKDSEGASSAQEALLWSSIKVAALSGDTGSVEEWDVRCHTDYEAGNTKSCGAWGRHKQELPRATPKETGNTQRFPKEAISNRGGRLQGSFRFYM